MSSLRESGRLAATRRRARAPTRALSTRTASSFADLDPGAWDALPRGSFFPSSRWLRSVEGTLSPENAYVVVEERGRPVAGLAAYLARPDTFQLLNPPELVLWDELRERVAAFLSAEERSEADELARRLRPELADRYPVAVCVAPYSCAAAIVGRVEERAVAEELVDALGRVAGEWGARGVALLYADEPRHPGLAGALRDRGYLSAALAARCVLPIEWSSFEEYVASLSKKQRWKVRNETKAFEDAGLRTRLIEGAQLSDAVPELAPLYAKLQRKYGHPEEAAETLEWIEARFADVTLVVVVEDDDGPIAFDLVYEADGVLYAYITGQTYDDRARAGFAFFHALYYEPIRLAVARGIRRIDYGLETDTGKTSRGCVLEPLTAFFDFGERVRADLGRLLELHDRAQRARIEHRVGTTRG